MLAALKHLTNLVKEILIKDANETLNCLLPSVVNTVIIRQDAESANGNRIALVVEVSKKRKEVPENQVPSFRTI